MKKILYKSLALIFATIALTSCLKDDSYVLDPDKAGANVIDFLNPAEIPAPGTSTNPLYVFSFPISTTPTPIDLTVSYSGVEDAAPKDITVNIGLAAQSVIDTLNKQRKATLLMMPSTWYTLSATSVVIPKGKKTATFKINVNTSLIDLTKSYALPLQLTSTDATVSSNFGTAIFQVGAKNKYDGIYKNLTGYFQRWSGGLPTTEATDALVGTMQYNADISIVTIDATTVEIRNMRWGSSTGSGSGSTIGGINNLQAVIDPVTNLVTMKALGNATLANIPGSVNKYDPATKTFTLNFDWNQATPTKREVTNYTFTYKAVRP